MGDVVTVAPRQNFHPGDTDCHDLKTSASSMTFLAGAC